MFLKFGQFIAKNFQFLIQKLISVRRWKLLTGVVLLVVLLGATTLFALQQSKPSTLSLEHGQSENAPAETQGQVAEATVSESDTQASSGPTQKKTSTTTISGDFSLSTTYIELEPGATGEITLTSQEPLLFNFSGDGRNKVMGGLQPASPVKSHTFKVSATSLTKPGETYVVKFSSQRKGSSAFLQTKNATVKIVGKRFSIAVSNNLVPSETEVDSISLPIETTWYYGLSGTLSYTVRQISAPAAGQLIATANQATNSVQVQLPETAPYGEYVFELEARDATGYKAIDRFTIELAE